MTFELSWTDIVPALIGLLASVIAAGKDVMAKQPSPDAHQDPGDKATGGRYVLDFEALTPVGIAAIFLAIAAFSMTLFSTNKAKASEKAKADELKAVITTTATIKDAAQQILGEVKTSLPGTVQRGLEDSRKQIGQAVSGAVSQAETSLTTAISNTARLSGLKLKASIDDMVADSASKTKEGLAEAIKHSQTRIREGFETVVRDSKQDLVETVTHTADLSQKKVTVALEQQVDRSVAAIRQAAEEISGHFEEAVASQAMQIPLRVSQNSAMSLPGRLSSLRIEVGDISRTRKFPVWIKSEDDRVEITCDTSGNSGRCLIDPKARGNEKSHTLPFRYRGRQYKLEIVLDVSTNLFGEAPDYLNCRVKEVKSAQVRR